MFLRALNLWSWDWYLALNILFEIGNLADWWSNKEDKEFRDRAQCFVDQYGSFTVMQLAKMLERMLGFRWYNISIQQCIEYHFLCYNAYYIITLNLFNFSYAAYANVPNAFLLNVNGTLTMDENIADTGGVKEAYYAYGKYYNIYKDSILLTIMFMLHNAFMT